MRQVAALPFRSDCDAGGGTVRVLLVTSRETRRWVLPKGNIDPGLSPAEAAAQEAEEEAGVRGRIADRPIGRYRYAKRRANGSVVMADVDVFPLHVTVELDAWPEQHQRERRWFSLADAANAVDEADLRALIRAFGA